MVNNAKSTEEAKLNGDELINVLKHNFGALLSQVSDNTKNFIQQIGNSAANIFNPIKANYLIVINGNLDKKAQEQIVGSSAIKTTLELESNGSNHLFDQIFNHESTQSLISAVSAFSKELEKQEFYIFSQDKNFSNYYENFGLSMSVDANGNVKIEDKQVNKVHNADRFQKCVNKAIGNAFRFDASQNTIFKMNTSEKIVMDANNSADITTFLTELCGMNHIASSFKKNNASFLAIEVTSLPKLEKVLSAEQYAFAQQILAQTIRKVVSHYEKTHKNNNYGQVIFSSESDNQYLASSESKNMKVRVLAETLTATNDQVAQAQSYTLRSWFGLFFVAMVVFICYALFNVEIAKDSLLYAKFLAEERR